MLQTVQTMLHNEPPKAPPNRISQCRSEAFSYLPNTVNMTRVMTSRTSHVPDLDIINKETFQEILAEAEGPTIPQR